MDREEGDPEGTTRSPEGDPPVTTSLIMSSIDRNWVTTEGVFHSNVVWSLDGAGEATLCENESA